MTVRELMDKCVRLLRRAGIKSPRADVDWLASDVFKYRRSELALHGHKMPTREQVDRMRENIPKHLKNTLHEVVNISLNDTLSRTVITSITTLMVAVILFLLGGEVIKLFAFALIVF